MDFVDLWFKRNRGWPSPEECWGLEPMFGEQGWCRACGTPLREQRGSLMLRRSGLTVTGAWVPNWRFDVICLASDLAERVAQRFRVDLREVAWPRPGGPAAMQIVAPTVSPAWFDPDDLAERATARHGSAGATCSSCGIWRWMPLDSSTLPSVRPAPSWEQFGVVASPEWFGDGCNSFRHILVRRELADMIATASPNDFGVREVL